MKNGIALVLGLTLFLPALSCRSASKKGAAPFWDKTIEEASLLTLRRVEAAQADQSHWRIRWEPDGKAYPISIYWSKRPDDFHYGDQPLAVLKEGQEVVVANPDLISRPYFLLVPRLGQPRVAADRVLPLESRTYCRDLGGYATEDGRQVKWGEIYRCSDLHDLTSRDLSYLSRLDIKLVVDLRTAKESRRRPDSIPRGAIRLPIPISIGDYDDVEARLPAITPAVLMEANRLWVKGYMGDFGDFIRRTFHESNRPVLIHDTHGIHRAGLASAIFLWLLGVPQEAIMEDYLYPSAHPTPKASLPQPLKVHKEYLEAAIETLRAEYGSVENYLQKGLGITSDQRRRLQDALLEVPQQTSTSPHPTQR